MYLCTQSSFFAHFLRNSIGKFLRNYMRIESSDLYVNQGIQSSYFLRKLWPFEMNENIARLSPRTLQDGWTVSGGGVVQLGLSFSDPSSIWDLFSFLLLLRRWENIASFFGLNTYLFCLYKACYCSLLSCLHWSSLDLVEFLFPPRLLLFIWMT